MHTPALSLHRWFGGTCTGRNDAAPEAALDRMEGGGSSSSPSSHWRWAGLAAPARRVLVQAAQAAAGAAAGFGLACAFAPHAMAGLAAGGAGLGVLAGCAFNRRGTPTARDYARHPMIALHAGSPLLYAVSDVHGHTERVMPLLARYGLIVSADVAPKEARWAGGTAHLVVVGDMIDKGPQSVDALQMFMQLQPQARRAGGRLTVCVGNHEAEFLANPCNKKAAGERGINPDIRAHGWTPEHFATDDSPFGHWLRRLPLGAKVGRWFFCHAGNTQGMSVARLEAYLQKGLDRHGYASRRITGRNSLLESRDWWRPHRVAKQYTRALEVDHIVFGHAPSALGPKGRMGIRAHGELLRIDCGMSDKSYSDGALLRVRNKDQHERAECLWPSGQVDLLWEGVPHT